MTLLLVPGAPAVLITAVPLYQMVPTVSSHTRSSHLCFLATSVIVLIASSISSLLMRMAHSPEPIATPNALLKDVRGILSLCLDFLCHCDFSRRFFEGLGRGGLPDRTGNFAPFVRLRCRIA